MESQPANVETWKRRAKRLLRHCDVYDYFRIDDRGVWPEEPWDTIGDDGELEKFGRWRNSPDGNIGDVFGQWRPARVLAAKGCEIDPADTPALPFPFDAKELAAFMVNGMGAFVAEWYCDGDWDNGLSMEALEQSIPVDEVWLRQTVREAIDAYRVAKEAIACPDGEHPDPDEIVWQLLKPDDAPAAPPTGQQDAPESNEDVEDGRLPDCHGSQALAEDVKARQDRRNQRLNQLGATFVPHGNGWRVNGPRGVLAQLEREERAAGRPKSDKSDLRRDLQAAYERARQGSC